MFEKIMDLAKEAGFEHYGEVNMQALRFLPEVRDMCSADSCHNYGKSWSCPPACPPLEETSRQVQAYQHGLLVQTTTTLADEFDYESMTQAADLHKSRFEQLKRQALILDPTCLPMGAGACTLCRKCTYPSKPCRYPDRMAPSMEAYGLLVSDVCVRSGLEYNYGPKTMTYTSMILTDHR